MRNLQLKSPMMHGSSVRRLQELGDLIGFDTGPNDGVFGPDTKSAVEKIQNHLGLDVDGICGPITWGELLDHIDELDLYIRDREVVAKFDNYDISIYNRIGMHPEPKLYGWRRDWSRINGITLHQTGCKMPKEPSGWDRLNAHIGITKAGKIIIVNDMQDMIWHAQYLSKNTIGVEFEGNFRGVEKDPGTLWEGGGPAAELTREQISAAKILFWQIFAKFKGIDNIKHVYAHRQSSGTRAGDPGELIWKTIGLEWQHYLGANPVDPDKSANRDFEKKFGTGRPIPKQWDKRSDVRYW